MADALFFLTCVATLAALPAFWYCICLRSISQTHPGFFCDGGTMGFYPVGRLKIALAAYALESVACFWALDLHRLTVAGVLSVGERGSGAGLLLLALYLTAAVFGYMAIIRLFLFRRHGRRLVFVLPICTLGFMLLADPGLHLDKTASHQTLMVIAAYGVAVFALFAVMRFVNELLPPSFVDVADRSVDAREAGAEAADAPVSSAPGRKLDDVASRKSDTPSHAADRNPETVLAAKNRKQESAPVENHEPAAVGVTAKEAPASGETGEGAQSVSGLKDDVREETDESAWYRFDDGACRPDPELAGLGFSNWLDRRFEAVGKTSLSAERLRMIFVPMGLAGNYSTSTDAMRQIFFDEIISLLGLDQVQQEAAHLLIADGQSCSIAEIRELVSDFGSLTDNFSREDRRAFLLAAFCAAVAVLFYDELVSVSERKLFYRLAQYYGFEKKEADAVFAELICIYSLEYRPYSQVYVYSQTAQAGRLWRGAGEVQEKADRPGETEASRLSSSPHEATDANSGRHESPSSLSEDLPEKNRN
ncbi:MAG: hypothetical protein IJ523_04900 [Succinivibrionaceae bacterium]|nr:hypothetical protein [Succinivibrionaceae bacterium]